MGVEPNIQHLPARNEVLNAYSSHEKVLRVFRGQELTSLEQGLSRMAAWVKQNGARQSQKFENIEVTKNFPLAWLSS
jgi:UDP-glucose 4-epimerase